MFDIFNLNPVEIHLIMIRAIQVLLIISVIVIMYMFIFNKDSTLTKRKFQRFANKNKESTDKKPRHKAAQDRMFYVLVLIFVLTLMMQSIKLMFLTIIVITINQLSTIIKIKGFTLMEHAIRAKRKLESQDLDKELYDVLPFLESTIDSLNEENVAIETILEPLLITARPRVKGHLVTYLTDYRDYSHKYASDVFAKNINTEFAKKIMSLFTLVDNKATNLTLMEMISKEKELYAYNHASSERTKLMFISGTHYVLNMIMFLILANIGLQAIFNQIAQNIGNI